MFADILREVFFPRKCLGCGLRIAAGAACPPCLALIPRRDFFVCGECRARIPGPDLERICHHDFPYILGAAGDYGHPLMKTLVRTLKFERCREAALTLGGLLGALIERTSVNLPGFIVVPLPLSKRRRRERGFNQSDLIARRFAAQRGLPLHTGALLRTRHAPPQSETRTALERRENVLGAFSVRGSLPAPDIILVDDVTTSGATFREAALALKAAGARKIIALACAKA